MSTGQSNGFSIDVDPAAPGIQTEATIPVGGSFTVEWMLEANLPWLAYQQNMAFDDRVVRVDGEPEDTLLGDAPLCGGTLGEDHVYRGCARTSGLSDASGVTQRISMTCIGDGEVTLRFLTNAEIGVATGTNTAIEGGFINDPAEQGALGAATITCGAGGDLPTETPFADGTTRPETPSSPGTGAGNGTSSPGAGADATRGAVPGESSPLPGSTSSASASGGSTAAAGGDADGDGGDPSQAPWIAIGVLGAVMVAALAGYALWRWRRT
jgi:hypothetical protein